MTKTKVKTKTKMRHRSVQIEYMVILLIKLLNSDIYQLYPGLIWCNKELRLYRPLYVRKLVLHC